MSTTHKTPNFADRYAPAQLKAWNLPAFADVRPDDGIFRTPLVKWSTLPSGADQDGEAELYYVCADVLVIDTEVHLMAGTLLFARRVLLAAGGRMVFHGEVDTASLLLVTNQITDTNGEKVPLELTIISADGTHEEVRQLSTTWGQRSLNVYEIEIGTTDLKVYPATQLDPALLYDGEPLRMFLRSEFQLATLLMKRDPVESIGQLDYVSAVANASAETRALSGQAYSLATQLRAARDIGANALLVPRLDYTVYATSARNALELLKLRQDNYQALRDSADNLDQWKQNASLALAVGGEQEALTRQLLEKARRTRNQVETARSIAARQVAAIQISLLYKRAEFENGVELWKEKKILKDIFSIIVGIVKILAEIPTLVATGPAAAATTAAGLAKGLGSVAGVLTTIGGKVAALATRPQPGGGGRGMLELDDYSDGSVSEETFEDFGYSSFPPPGDASDDEDTSDQDADEIVDEFTVVDAEGLEEAEAARQATDEAAEKAREAVEKQSKAFFESAGKVAAAGKDIADAALDIYATVQKARQMEAASQQAIVAIGKGIDQSFADITPHGLDVVTGGSQTWDRLSITIKAFFDLVPDEVPGKRAFQEEYERLIISGQAMCQARLALAKANSELAEAVLRLASAKRTDELYQARLDSLGERIVHDETLAQLAYDKILDAKRGVYLSLEAYQRAFVYFTLQPASRVAKLPDLAAPYADIATTVSKITSPQLADDELQRPANKMPRVTIMLKGDALTSEFRDQGVLQFSLTPDHPDFNGFCRIRLNEIEVYADGLGGTEKIAVDLTSNGSYADRDFYGKIRHFVTDRYRSRIVYYSADQSLIFSGKIEERLAYHFFAPTPFSTWTMVVRSLAGEQLDYSTVSAVRVVFSGKSSTPG